MRVQKIIICFLAIIAIVIFVSPASNNRIGDITKTENITTTTSITKPESKITTSTTLTTETEKVTEESTTVQPVTSTTKQYIEETTTVTTTECSTITGNEYEVPSNGGKFKSYTNYKLLSKNSPQWTKIQCHEDAYTDSNGLRKVGDYYCVAMGSYYSTTLGDLFEIKTEGGTYKVILCDYKSNYHTDAKNQYTTHNNCVTEFYVDMNTLNSTVKQMGDVSYADSNFKGKIVSITKIGNYFE